MFKHPEKNKIIASLQSHNNRKKRKRQIIINLPDRHSNELSPHTYGMPAVVAAYSLLMDKEK